MQNTENKDQKNDRKGGKPKHIKGHQSEKYDEIMCFRGSEEMTDKEVAEWLMAIKEKYIHGGDEQFDSCRKEALDIAANRMKERKINSIRMLIDENGKMTPLEQPKMQLKYSANMEEYWHYESICPKCENRWISMGHDNFCPACGQPVYEPTEEGEQE